MFWRWYRIFYFTSTAAVLTMFEYRNVCTPAETLALFRRKGLYSIDTVFIYLLFIPNEDWTINRSKEVGVGLGGWICGHSPDIGIRMNVEKASCTTAAATSAAAAAVLGATNNNLTSGYRERRPMNRSVFCVNGERHWRFFVWTATEGRPDWHEEHEIFPPRGCSLISELWYQVVNIIHAPRSPSSCAFFFLFLLFFFVFLFPISKEYRLDVYFHFSFLFFSVVCLLFLIFLFSSFVLFVPYFSHQFLYLTNQNMKNGGTAQTATSKYFPIFIPIAASFFYFNLPAGYFFRSAFFFFHFFSSSCHPFCSFAGHFAFFHLRSDVRLVVLYIHIFSYLFNPTWLLYLFTLCNIPLLFILAFPLLLLLFFCPLDLFFSLGLNFLFQFSWFRFFFPFHNVFRLFPRSGFWDFFSSLLTLLSNWFLPPVAADRCHFLLPCLVPVFNLTTYVRRKSRHGKTRGGPQVQQSYVFKSIFLSCQCI